MVSFAFKNVVLFAMIILIVHVLLKNAIIERERTRLWLEEKFSTVSSTAERRKRAQSLADLDDGPDKGGRRKRRPAYFSPHDDDEGGNERFEDEDAWISPRLLQAARASSSSSGSGNAYRGVENTSSKLRRRNNNRGGGSGEEDMLRYVEEGDTGEGNMITDIRATPHLTASFSAHRLPPRAANELADDDTDVKPSPFASTSYLDTPAAAKKPRKSSAVATAALSRENSMNGGKLFAEVDDEGDMGLKGANAFDTNYQTFGDEYGEEEDGDMIDADLDDM